LPEGQISADYTRQKIWDVLLSVLYGYEVWSPILREEHNRLKTFDNRVPEKDIGHNRKKDEAVKLAY
jgi:hypothetical protein